LGIRRSRLPEPDVDARAWGSARYESSGNLTVDVRARDHHGDLVIAMALALWSAVGRPSGRVEVGRLEGWY
jgi:hypothetical protein